MPEISVVADGQDGSIRRVLVAGEIDLAAAGELHSRLTEAAEGSGAIVIVDLSECLFIDSRGLSTLLNSARSLTHSRGALAVVCPNPTPRRVFEITGTADTLNVATTDEQARTLALHWRRRLASATDAANG